LILGKLLQVLESLTFSEGVDFWVYDNDSLSIYSVISTYKILHMRANVVDERSAEIVQLVAKVWESWFPLKINVFFW
jgi:hypothetical protein